MDASRHFQQLARYNLWASQRLLEAVRALEDAAYHADAGLFFKSIHGTLNHLLVGEHLLWRRRFAEGVSPVVALDAQVHSQREPLAQALLDGAAQWQPLIASWEAARFDGHLHYTTMRGQAQRLPFAATLSHVFNHATHHRGQITAALTRLGADCPELDLIYLLQQENTH